MDVLGIDIGGSTIKAAIVDVATGQLESDFLQIETPRPATPQAIAESINALVTLLRWNGVVGCGFPAVIRDGVAITAANIDSSWIDCDIPSLLQTATGCYCVVLNDADAAGLAEMKFGAGQGRAGAVLMLTLGTGIGSALFYNERLFPNLELGHLMVNGMVVERYTSAAVRINDALSWQEWAERLNRVFYYIERLFSPDLIIIGGGVSEQAEQFFPLLNTRTELTAAHMKNRAGLIGSALFAAENLYP